MLIAATVLAVMPVRGQEARVALDLEPFVSKSSPWPVRPEIEPVLASGRVLVSSTLRLYAVDARTGELAWSAGPPDGWEALRPDMRGEYFQGLDPESLHVAPAAGEHVAVAALQVPVAREPNDNWQGIEIQKTMPERRLFAFELDTGCPLWDHAPPPGWDGTSGSFAQRMRVIGSPLVAGERVLVPCTYDLSSIDYHVACYELATGRLSWRTFVTRGQVARSLYEYQLEEFVAAPLVYDANGRVLAQTGLGTIVALHLPTGELAWRTDYAAIPLRKHRNYTPPKPNRVWRMTPPLIAGDTLLATPPDSEELLALDLATGDLLWKRTAKELAALDPATEERAFDHLAAADANGLVLGGAKLAALTLPAGLRSAQGLAPLWTRPITNGKTRTRAHLVADALLLPSPRECLAFDRRTGEPRAPIAAGDALGLLVTDEALFVLTPKELRRIER